MNLSYNRLWKMLYNLNVAKMEFANSIGISNATLAKLGKDEPVSLTVLMKICEYYSCKIENIIEFIPDKENTYPDISTLGVGTILICTCYPLGTSVRTQCLSKRTNILKKHPCVVLQGCSEDGYVPKLLAAPLLYDLCPDTIFDIPFKNLEIGTDFIKCGYIQIGRIGYASQKDCENVLGTMPGNYINNALEILKKIKSIIN